jgi:hypothetical protein
MPAFVITGAPAVIIILVIIALLLLGVLTFFRMTARGAKRVVGRVEHRGEQRGDGPRT